MNLAIRRIKSEWVKSNDFSRSRTVPDFRDDNEPEVKKVKSFLPYDKRVRLDEVTAKNVRDIMKWTGAKTEGEAVRNAVRANWQHLDEIDRMKRVKTQ